MSDADDQLGGTGGQRGKSPEEETAAAPDPKTGNTDQVRSEPAQPKSTGEGQAAANRENDPPA